jgi:hypothetical protein
VLQSHVVLGLESDTGTEDVGEARTLLGESVDDRSALGNEGSLSQISIIRQRWKYTTYLEHVAKNTEHAMKPSVLGITGLGAMGLPLHTCHDLSNKNEIDDQRSSKKRVLADVEQADRLVTVQEDLGIILVKRTLIVSNRRHVLDDDAVVRVFTLFVKDIVGSHHVVDHVGLGNLLGTELLLGAEVHAVVIAEMVVAGN